MILHLPVGHALYAIIHMVRALCSNLPAQFRTAYILAIIFYIALNTENTIGVVKVARKII